MKKSLLSLLLFTAFLSTKAQLANTKWKGTIQADETLNVVFHFGNDTLEVVNTGDASTLEVLTYAIKDNMITLQKVSGQSECGADAAGQYKYVIKDNEITFMLVNDGCNQREAVLNNSKWTKVAP